MGGDDSTWPYVHVRVRFQSTPPHGRRPQWPLHPRHPINVSIHASAWEATRHAAVCKSAPTNVPFQSTPPHGRRHHAATERCRLTILCVSIHASAWEATRRDRRLRKRCALYVSIHASAWEATLKFPHRVRSVLDNVSIHASAWEATLSHPSLLSQQWSRSFNPRLRMGGDQADPSGGRTAG